jgi:3-hydroxyacyl-CoA dehydrogenase
MPMGPCRVASMGNINPSIDLQRDGEIALIRLDNPPVNALKHEVRAGLIEALTRVQADDLKAVVLLGGGRAFSAGADISEFGAPPRAPGLHQVLATIETMPKPVIAAIHGVALGGGLELALACHYRLATPDARLGLPEIKLGILPGAGGTQRLPRLVGPNRALEAIVTGDPMLSDEALRAGLIDEIASGDLVTAAVGFARKILTEGRPLTLVRDREDKIADARAQPQAYEDAAARILGRLRGRRAQTACVESVRNAFSLPFDEGCAREQALFRELVVSDESRAQRHVFFAEREAARVPDMPPSTTARPFARAAVIGAGTMGGGIAMCFANVGIPVSVIETSREALDRGLDRVAANYRTTLARGRLTPGEMDQRLALMTRTLDLAAVADADVVVEAVFEEMDVKKQIFGELDRLARPNTLLATNTSTLDVDAIAQSTQRPQDVLGTHFFSPANVMRLLEIVRGRATSHHAIATAIALGRKLGKVPVVVGNCDGFVGNRMLARRSIESERLLLEGALPQEVDAAVMGFGFPMGPFAMSDLAGNDVGWRIRRARGVTAPIADALCEAGRFGQKTGKGYFLYEKGSRTPLPDPEVEQLILEASRRAGVTRGPVSQEEIVERMVYPMINEGARILETGIAYRPGDIDVVWVYGYGWPVWRGGPMFFADGVGLGHIRDRLAHYAERSGDGTLKPAPLLDQLAAKGQGFAAFRPPAGSAA